MNSTSHVAALLLALAAVAGGGNVLAADVDSVRDATARKAALAKLCASCAIVQSVKTETRKGKSSGLGIVGGAVAGGVLGNQVGGGAGKTTAIVGGAVGGGLLGNEVEKHVKRYTVWITTVTMKDGSLRRFEADADPHFRKGDVVSASNGRLHRAG